MNYEIKILRELDSNAKKYWQELESKAHNYCFQNYSWFENWFTKFRSKNKKFSPCIVIVSVDSKILYIFPFEIKKTFNIKILQWAGGRHADYCAPILIKDFHIKKNDFLILWKKVVNLIPDIDLIYFNKQPEFIEEIKNPFVEFLDNYEDSIVYSALLPKTWEEYTSTVLKKNFYTQNLRKERLLKNLGDVQFNIVTNQDEKKILVGKLIQQKNTRLKSLRINNIFGPKDLDFYSSFENYDLETMKTHLCSLTLNNELIAIHWGIIYKNRFYYLLLSMKEENLGKYSPGRLLISSMIQWSIENKIRVFDFTLGGEEYKKNWSNNKSGLFNHLKLNNIKGLALYWILKVKLIVKSFKGNN